MSIKLFSKIPFWTITRIKYLSTSISNKNKLKSSILYLPESHSAKPYILPRHLELKSKISRHQLISKTAINFKQLPRKISMVESHSAQPWTIN